MFRADIIVVEHLGFDSGRLQNGLRMVRKRHLGSDGHHTAVSRNGTLHVLREIFQIHTERL